MQVLEKFNVTHLFNIKPLFTFFHFFFYMFEMRAVLMFHLHSWAGVRDALSMWGMPWLLHFPTGTQYSCQRRTCTNTSLRNTKDHLIMSLQNIISDKTLAWKPETKSNWASGCQSFVLWIFFFTGSLLSLVFTPFFTNSTSHALCFQLHSHIPACSWNIIGDE